jgi:hypothetical protein
MQRSDIVAHQGHLWNVVHSLFPFERMMERREREEEGGEEREKREEGEERDGEERKGEESRVKLNLMARFPTCY